MDFSLVHYLVLLFWLGMAVITGVVASSRGRSGLAWGLVGAIFGFFALLAVGLMPIIKKPENH